MMTGLPVPQDAIDWLDHILGVEPVDALEALEAAMPALHRAWLEDLSRQLLDDKAVVAGAAAVIDEFGDEYGQWQERFHVYCNVAEQVLRAALAVVTEET